MINWPEITRCFSVLRPVRWIDPGAREFIEGLNDDQTVIVACSGGADSVFLVLTVYSLLGPGRMVIAHFNHGIRGSEADADEEFVKDLAKALGVKCSVGYAESHIGRSEASMRKARYDWLVALYNGVKATAIVLGHHADDLLETQLMALFTGSGPGGLSSPMPVRSFPDGHVRVRPLLPMKRSTIETTLRSLNAPWREDSSNTDTSYTRNWIRKELLPLVDRRMPQDIYAGSRRTQRLMQDSVEAIDRIIVDMQLDLSDPGGFEVAGLESGSPGIIRRVLFGWWMRHFGEDVLSSNSADTIIRMIQDGATDQPVSIGVLSCTGDAIQALVINDHGRLVLQAESPIASMQWKRGCHWTWQAGPVFLPKGRCLYGESVTWDSGENPYLDADPKSVAWLHGVDGPLYVRQWQDGDRYRPLGAPGTRKLQDVFGDAKLNSEQKQALPVLLNSNGEILWVPGFPPAEHARISPCMKSALRLTYRTL